MKHYVAVLVSQAGGGWRACLSHFPACGGDGTSVQIAVQVAISMAVEAAKVMQSKGRPLPAPTSYEDLRYHNNGWAIDRRTEWSTAVISLIPVPVGTENKDR